MDNDILACPGHNVRVDEDQEDGHERGSCFYCLDGWVFLGSVGPEGEEVYEAVRCRRCGGTGRLPPELG